VGTPSSFLHPTRSLERGYAPLPFPHPTRGLGRGGTLICLMIIDMWAAGWYLLRSLNDK